MPGSGSTVLPKDPVPFASLMCLTKRYFVSLPSARESLDGHSSGLNLAVRMAKTSPVAALFRGGEFFLVVESDHVAPHSLAGRNSTVTRGKLGFP